VKRRSLLAALTVVIVLVGSLAMPAGRSRTARASHADAVIDWNQTMLATFWSVNLPPPVGNRDGAIVQAAVFDALNGIERRYTPIHVPPDAPPGASRQAAVVSAAYTALVSLFPAQKQSLDAAFATSVASIAEDEQGGSQSIARGLAWGKTVGDAIVTWRAADGFAATPPPYAFGTDPGVWQPTPGGSGPPKFRTLATTTPFALTSPSQFRPAGPPALTSARYTASFNEVKAFGGQFSAVRTGYQTETAKFWQLDTVTGIWDRVADSLLQADHRSLLQHARILALTDIAFADSTIATWDAKNTFNFWRPVTAIQQAATDGNPNTSPDPNWMPLLVTPYFQEYPSAHAGISSGGASVLASFYGANAEFTVTSQGLPGVQRTFHSFTDAVEQVADARIFAGFHYRFSTDDGIQLGKQVAAQVERTMMLPMRGEGDPH
jgi:hypothetical protein